MSSYLDTIRQLQSHIENKDVIKKVKQYNSYEDYLHQRNGKQKTEKKIAKPTYSKIVNRIDEEKTHTTARKYHHSQRNQISSIFPSKEPKFNTKPTPKYSACLK